MMAILDVRTASPRELAEELEIRLNNLSYHIEVLKELDCIELVEQRPRQGSRVIEHFYRATRMPYLDQDAWDQLDEGAKWGVVVPIMRLSSGDISESMAAGVFLDPDDNHLSRTPLTVDLEGWEEVKGLLGDTLEGLLQVRLKVAERAREGGKNETMQIKVHIFQFRSPDRDENPEPPDTARG